MEGSIHLLIHFLGNVLGTRLEGAHLPCCTCAKVLAWLGREAENEQMGGIM